ncbi:MAG: outer membrane beta-barrel protein [bacterium]
MRKSLLLPVACLILAAAAFPTAAMADDSEIINGGFGLGLGFSDANQDGGGDFMALAQYRGAAWEVQVDYVFGDNKIWAIHGDYIWNAEREPSSPESGLYFGGGYTYASFDTNDLGVGDNEDTDSGLNAVVGYDFDKNWGVEGRWAFLSDDYINVNIAYNFGDDSQSGDY